MLGRLPKTLVLTLINMIKVEQLKRGIKRPPQIERHAYLLPRLKTRQHSTQRTLDDTVHAVQRISLGVAEAEVGAKHVARMGVHVVEAPTSLILSPDSLKISTVGMFGRQGKMRLTHTLPLPTFPTVTNLTACP